MIWPLLEAKVEDWSFISRVAYHFCLTLDFYLCCIHGLKLTHVCTGELEAGPHLCHWRDRLTTGPWNSAMNDQVIILTKMNKAKPILVHFTNTMFQCDCQARNYCGRLGALIFPSCAKYSIQCENPAMPQLSCIIDLLISRAVLYHFHTSLPSIPVSHSLSQL